MPSRSHLGTPALPGYLSSMLASQVSTWLTLSLFKDPSLSEVFLDCPFSEFIITPYPYTLGLFPIFFPKHSLRLTYYMNVCYLLSAHLSITSTKAGTSVSFSAIYAQCPEQCQAHSRPRVNMPCNNERMDGGRGWEIRREELEKI